MDYLFLVLVSCCLIKATVSTECALIKGYNQYLYDTLESSYVQLPGTYDVDDYFDVWFDVFINPLSSDGPMFSIGSKRNFTYFDIEDRDLRYVVLNFQQGSLALAAKGPLRFHEELVLSRTWPHPYNIADKQWHRVHAWRHNGGPVDEWRLEIDDVPHVGMPVTTQTSTQFNDADVQLYGKEAFIGGRPDYTKMQFQGVIKNVHINHISVALRGIRTNGITEVSDCRSPDTTRFMNHILAEYRFYD